MRYGHGCQLEELLDWTRDNLNQTAVAIQQVADDLAISNPVAGFSAIFGRWFGWEPSMSLPFAAVIPQECPKPFLGVRRSTRYMNLGALLTLAGGLN